MAGMIILAGTFRVGLGMRAAAQDALAAMVTASRAEPGCQAYSFAFDALDDHLVRVFEIYTDADALAAHRASDHMAVFRALWPELGLSDRNMAQYAVAHWTAI